MIYISGPMSGLQENNYPAFESVYQKLKPFCISPHNIHDGADNLSYEGYLARDVIALITKCNEILMLNGWENSRGAKLEFAIAKELNFKIHYQEKEDSK